MDRARVGVESGRYSPLRARPLKRGRRVRCAGMEASATRPTDAAAHWALAGQWPFVGRGGELAALGRVLASGGAVRGAIVCGPAGVGKSRLVRQVAQRYESTVGAPWFLRGSDPTRPETFSALGGRSGAAGS